MFYRLLLLFFIITGTSVYSQEKKFVISSIDVSGNKLTKWPIIERELTFHLNDSLNREQITKSVTESRQNVMNTLLFNFVTITPSYPDSFHVQFKITVVESWYIWPAPLFEIVSRNFNEWWQTKDLNRVNYGLYISHDNFRGRAEKLSVGFRGGYTQQYFTSYSIPYINKGRKLGASFSYSYARYHEINYNTLNNKQEFYTNFGFYSRQHHEAGTQFTYRKEIHQSHAFKLNYKHFRISDSAVVRNPDYFKHGERQVDYFSLGYYYRLDYRDYRSYPLKGYYIDLDLSQAGLGIVSNDLNSFYITTNLRKFWHLKNRFYYAAGLALRQSFNQYQFFYNQVGLGYDDYVRGFEYYVIPGQSYGLLQTNLKFVLMKEKISHIKWIKSEKFSTAPHSFYLNAFIDAGGVRDRYFTSTNPLANKIQLGYGLGLDYLTYYNWVMRVEYSFNNLRENGLFLHFTAPI